MIKSGSLLIIVDNLRIGGIQRFAVDECYALNKKNIHHLLVSLSSFEEHNSILAVDGGFNQLKQLNIEFIGGGKLNQLKTLGKLIDQDINLVVSHSATGTALIRTALLFKRKKVRVFLYIHQLISLSSKKQAFKRLIYFLFASKLFVSSNQFKLEIDDYLKHKWWGVLFRKKISFDRMGIFLDRVDNQTKKIICMERSPHLIFSSRMTEWKGFKIFSNLATNPRLKSHQIVFQINKMNAKENEKSIESKIHYIYASSPVCYKYPANSVHVYPTDYGNSIKYPQSIGMNVLEYLALGVPSLISREGFESWPEFRENILIETCDWTCEGDMEKKFKRVLSLDQASIRIESIKLRKHISIENHINKLVNSMRIEKQSRMFDKLK